MHGKIAEIINKLEYEERRQREERNLRIKKFALQNEDVRALVDEQALRFEEIDGRVALVGEDLTPIFVTMDASSVVFMPSVYSAAPDREGSWETYGLELLDIASAVKTAAKNYSNYKKRVDNNAQDKGEEHRSENARYMDTNKFQYGYKTVIWLCLFTAFSFFAIVGMVLLLLVTSGGIPPMDPSMLLGFIVAENFASLIVAFLWLR